jgi:hypothetical protein
MSTLHKEQEYIQTLGKIYLESYGIDLSCADLCEEFYKLRDLYRILYSKKPTS